MFWTIDYAIWSNHAKNCTIPQLLHNRVAFTQLLIVQMQHDCANATRLCIILHNRIALAQSSDHRRIHTISYVDLAQSGRTCTIIHSVSATRLCNLRSIVQKIAQSLNFCTIVLHLQNKWLCKCDPNVFFFNFKPRIHDDLRLWTDCVFISFHSCTIENHPPLLIAHSCFMKKTM